MSHEQRAPDGPSPIPIVLTGTITPRAISTVHSDPEVRRREYLKAVAYYASFAPIWLLENSGYRFAEDAEFSAIPNARYFEHTPSHEYSKGKGYQEFEMLDAWVSSAAPLPARFLKITGRYIVTNIAQVLSDCARDADSAAILERKIWPRHSARTDIALFSADFYKDRILGAYARCDDSARIYVENVVRQRVEGAPGIRVFRHVPERTGINGSKGTPLRSGAAERFKTLMRNLTYPLNPGYRFF